MIYCEIILVGIIIYPNDVSEININMKYGFCSPKPNKTLYIDLNPCGCNILFGVLTFFSGFRSNTQYRHTAYEPHHTIMPRTLF